MFHKEIGFLLALKTFLIEKKNTCKWHIQKLTTVIEINPAIKDGHTR